MRHKELRRAFGPLALKGALITPLFTLRSVLVAALAASPVGTYGVTRTSRTVGVTRCPVMPPCSSKVTLYGL